MNKCKSCLAASALALFACAGGVAAREGSQIIIDVYAGPTLTQSSDLGIDTTISGRLVKGTYSDVSYKSGVSFGGRAGWWFSQYAGVGFDALVQKIETKEQTTTLTLESAGLPTVTGVVRMREAAGTFSSVVLSPTLLLRIPFKRVEPYIGIGPGVFLNKYKETGVEESGTNIGLTAPVGVKVVVLEKRKVGLALMAESRIAYNPFKVSFRNSEIRNNLVSLNIILGASIIFDTGKE